MFDGVFRRGGTVTTPGLIVRALGALVVLAVVAGGLSLWASLSVQSAARTIGLDAEPSVALALGMAQALAEMDAAALGDSLLDGGAMTGTSAAFRLAMDRVGRDIVQASRNITYGAAEEVPLQDLQAALVLYQRAVDDARYVGAGNVWTTSHRVQWASRVNRDIAAEAARALSRANETALERAYAAYTASSLLLGAAAFLAFAVLVLALLAVQGWLAKRTRRTVNLPLAAATVVAGLGGLWFGVTILTEREALRAAKVDAYDSLLVLFDAKGQAAELRADMSLWLLDPDIRPVAAARMADALKALVGAPDLTRVVQLQPAMREAMRLESDGRAQEALKAVPEIGGLLGRELANITYGVAERQPATNILLALVHAMDVIRATQAQDVRRDHVFAVFDWLRETGNGGAVAFAAMQKALDDTIKVNQDEFDQHNVSARRLASVMPVAALGALALTVALAAAGLWQRLREYR